MTAIILGSYGRYTERLSNTGSSEAATKLMNQLGSTMSHLREAVTWNPLFFLNSEFQEILEECSTNDWDGYNACAITPEAYSEAIRFTKALPVGLPLPEIVPEADGGIGFEWSSGKFKVFVVSVNGSDVITYAGLYGKNRKTHGEEVFDENIPHNIIENVRRIFR